MRTLLTLMIAMLLLVAACNGDDGGTEPVDTGDAVAPVSTTVADEEVTEDEAPSDEIDATDAMTGTEEMGESTEMTATTGMTSTDDMTDDMTSTEEMTETAPMTATGNITAPMAAAVLLDSEGNTVGDASFTETDEGVEIQVTLREFMAAADGEHGLHIHTTGACTPDFSAAGGHFNPTGAEHGLENPNGPHAGDLPNLTVDADGNAMYQELNTIITLEEGETALMDADGSALVIHAGTDDMMTDPSGESGDRIACGVIEMQS